MLIKSIEDYGNIYGKIDAIMIVNKHDIVEYSAIVGPDHKLMTKDVIGKNIYEIYNNLDERNCTHAMVMRTGRPVIDQRQVLEDKNGNTFSFITNTFPIEDKGEVIGTIDISFDLSFEGNAHKVVKKGDLIRLDQIVAVDPKMIALKEKCERLGNLDAPVMVIGESGTGKELIVEGIHSAGKRASRPFISLNCAAIPDALMESILFGTVKGSFTGAETRKGLFEMADGGTLFLDELNSMPLTMQAKLLKAVEEQRFMRVGGEEYITVDVRIISAMNAEPEKVLEDGTLRRDLYYRLGIVSLEVPPLRHRRGDIPPLVDYFVQQFAAKMGRRIRGVDDDVLEAFDRYSWPGNVRELRNVMEAAFVMADPKTEYLRMEDLPDSLTAASSLTVGKESPTEVGLAEMVASYEKEILLRTLTHSRSVAEAASKLKLSRQSMRYKLMKYQIDFNKLM